MSQSEDHFYLQEFYEDISVFPLKEDYLEAVDVIREMEEMDMDHPSEYEIDRTLDALRNFNGNVEIEEVDEGNIYDVSEYTVDDHEQIVEDWLE